MAALSLKVNLVKQKTIKTLQFEPTILVQDALRIIDEKVPQATEGERTNYGLFLEEENERGRWLEPSRPLNFYPLASGDMLEYKSKIRLLKVYTMDGAVKTVQIDDSKTVGDILQSVCAKMGVGNSEEFSLVLYDETMEEGGEEMKTATLNRGTLKKDKAGTGHHSVKDVSMKKMEERDRRKMDEMKKKLHTDDEVQWLDLDKTLREQGIDDSHSLLLKRKFFYSDQNVDIKDPVQLNLLYMQCRDGIIKGSHPCNQEEAAQLGALQIQLQFGDFHEQFYKSGKIEIKEMLPKEYGKSKGIDKKIKEEHKKCHGLDELQAKFRYVQLCRSLKTYGVTFFLVKEKMKGKNKLVPRLLGITKESVLRLDEKTKEILKTWPLTTVRRWAASPNSFTLDFGDYTESYYSVQTVEGEKISQLIAGYIDIILKKKRGNEGYDMDADEESTMLEDTVAPSKGTILDRQTNKVSHAEPGLVALPGIMRTGGPGATQFDVGQMQVAQFGTVSGQAKSGHQAPMTGGTQPKIHKPGNAQQAFFGHVSQGLTSVRSARDEMEKSADLPPLGEDPQSLKWKQNNLDHNRQNVANRLAALSASTASIVTLTSGEPDESSYNKASAAVDTISSNLEELTKGIQMIAALMDDEDDGNKLQDAAKNLADAFSNLLKAAHGSPGAPDNQNRQKLLEAAGDVGTAGANVLNSMGGEREVDSGIQEMLLALAQAVANATAALVLKAKAIASKCDDVSLQSQVIGSAKDTAMTTSQLVACTKVLAPSINSQLCKDQVVEAAKLVSKAVEGTEGACKDASSDPNLLNDLANAAKGVRDALNNLLNKVQEGSPNDRNVGPYDDACDDILNATDRMFNSMGNAGEMVKQAKVLAQAMSFLVNGIKAQAEGEEDADLQKRLLAAAKNLADATAKMVEAAKGAARNPNDAKEQQKLREAASDIRLATDAAANNALKKKLIKRLEDAAKQASAMTTQLASAADHTSPANRNPTSQQLLQDQLKPTQEHVEKLNQTIQDSMNNPNNPTTQLNLINTSKDFIPPGTKLVAAAKAALPTIGDPVASTQLGSFAKGTAAALAELRDAANKAAEACGSIEIDSALEGVKSLADDLEALEKSADEGKLLPLPGESLESSSLDLGATSKTVGSSMAQLLTAAAQANENYTGIAARDTANALRVLTDAVRGVAAALEDRDDQKNIIKAAQEVMRASAQLLEEAKKATSNPNDPNNQQRLGQVAKDVSQSLKNCINCLPGQKDVDEAIQRVSKASELLSAEDFPPSEDNYQKLQDKVNESGALLNLAASDLVQASRGSPNELAVSSQKYSKSFENLMQPSMQLAGQTTAIVLTIKPRFGVMGTYCVNARLGGERMIGLEKTCDEDTKSALVRSLKNTSTASSKLLLAAKSLAADPNAPNSKNLLAGAARAVTDSINNLLNTAMTAAPGQKECESALRNIQAVSNLLENPVEPVNDYSFFDCLDSVSENSKALRDGMTDVSGNAKKGDMPAFDDAVKKVADAVIKLTEAASQAAYLVAISDPSSVAGKPGLVDANQFQRARHDIQKACDDLLNPASTQQQILQSATAVAKHTSNLCNVCKAASAKTNNPVAKKHFVQAAKDIANNTANLVKSIKVLAKEPNSDNRRDCAQHIVPLIDSVDDLNTYASSPEFAAVPAKISEEARSTQVPIIMSGRSLVTSSSNYLNSANALAMDRNDGSQWPLFNQHGKALADAMKRLLQTIKDSAPGQRECDEAIENINRTINKLDQASLAAIGHNLDTNPEGTLKEFQDRMLQSVAQIGDAIDPLASAAKDSPESIGHRVAKLANFIEPVAEAAISAASKMPHSQKQTDLLDQTKTVAESATELLYAVKDAGGNPKSANAHPIVDDAAKNMQDAVKDLTDTLEEAASETGAVTGLVESISKAMNEFEQNTANIWIQPNGRAKTAVQGSPPDTEEVKPFVHYQEKMTKTMKDLSRKGQDMVGRAGTDPSQLGPLGKDVTRLYNALTHDAQGAIQTASSPEVAERVRTGVQALGASCMKLVQNGGDVQANPRDPISMRDLADAARKVAEKISHILAALQSGSRGTQACINAATTIKGIVSDLDTTVMFATAGTLNPEKDDEKFTDHREEILTNAKALVEDTKALVPAAQASQDVLANAAQSAVTSINKLSDCVKLGAAALGADDTNAQVMLLNAVKDVASSLYNLLDSAKNSSGRHGDGAGEDLKNATKDMISKVSSLLMTVKSVEDKTSRGARALDSSMDAIKQAVVVLNSPTMAVKEASPEDLIRSTKPVTLATAKVVAAGNSGNQEEIAAAANLGRNAVTELLTTCKAAAAKAESEEVRNAVVVAGRESGTAFNSMLAQVHIVLQKPTNDKKQGLVAASRKVADCLGALVKSAEALKGSEWVNPEDPNVIAENELLGAASAIEAAARKLAELKPRERPRQADESLAFEEQILEAAKAIAAATSALVKSAATAQRELVASGVVCSTTSDKNEDGQWSQGLVSAARLVATAVNSLCEAANATVQGNATQENLIASAQQVSNSTAQLLLACRVKADPNSAGQKRLQAAGKAVKKASDDLVKAAQNARVFEEQSVTVIINQKWVGGIAQEIQAQEAIIRKERELEVARKKLMQIRQARYKDDEDSS